MRGPCLVRLGSALTVLAALAVSLSSCGEGHGELSQSVAEQHADYRLIDLSDGSSSYRAEVPDLGENPAYRDHLLVMHRLPPYTATIGAGSDEPFADDDERPAHQTAIGESYVAVFELTRAQWQVIAAGTSPWIDLGVHDGDSRHPATGMSQIEAETVLAAWSAQHGVNLMLPSADEWEGAARCTGGAFAFDPLQPSAVGAHARVAESLVTDSGTSSGTAPVGQRVANPWGFYDMQGNAAELTAGLDPDAFAVVRGGSWSDPVATTRATNSVAIPPQAGHPLVGLRLVVHP